MTRTPVAHIVSALAVVTLLAIASTGFSIVFIVVGAQRTSTVQQRLTRRQAEVDRALRAQMNVEAETERAKKMMERLQHLKETREDRDYGVDFARAVAQAAAETGNSVMAIQAAPPGEEGENPLTALRQAAATAAAAAVPTPNAATPLEIQTSGARLVEVTLRGTFDSALRFTENLYRFPHIIAVEEFRLQPDGAKRAGHQTQLMMKFRLATMPVRLRRVAAPDEDEDGILGRALPMGRS